MCSDGVWMGGSEGSDGVWMGGSVCSDGARREAVCAVIAIECGSSVAVYM